MSRSLTLAGVLPAYSAAAIFFLRALQRSSTLAYTPGVIPQTYIARVSITACKAANKKQAAMLKRYTDKSFAWLLCRTVALSQHGANFSSTFMCLCKTDVGSFFMCTCQLTKKICSEGVIKPMSSQAAHMLACCLIYRQTHGFITTRSHLPFAILKCLLGFHMLCSKACLWSCSTHHTFPDNLQLSLCVRTRGPVGPVAFRCCLLSLHDGSQGHKVKLRMIALFLPYLFAASLSPFAGLECRLAAAAQQWSHQ